MNDQTKPSQAAMDAAIEWHAIGRISCGPDAVKLATADLAKIIDSHLQRELAAANRALETEREERIMQLAAISTASLQNTGSSKQDRIDSSNPYWTAAYGDACRAVDREMRLRDQLTRERDVRRQLAKTLEDAESALMSAVDLAAKQKRIYAQNGEDVCATHCGWTENALRERVMWNRTALAASRALDGEAKS